MNIFAVTRAPRNIVFGWGQRAAIAGYASQLGTRALICTDARLGGSELIGEVVDALKAAGVASLVYSDTPPEVPIDAIQAAVDLARPFAPELVIGIGGGSCLDMAKATSLMLAHGGSVRDYYGEFKIPGPCLPVIAVPTTAGTGSEATPVAVLADTERTLKVGVASPYLIPNTAICDPELTLSCPRGLTAIAGADALTHAIEAITAGSRQVTGTIAHEHVFLGKNALSDSYASNAIRHLGQSLQTAVDEPENRQARESVMFGALMAGLAFGTAGTSAAHAIQYPVGAVTHTAHGAGVACVLPYAMQFNLPAAGPAMEEVGRQMGVAGAEAGEAAIDAVAKLFAAIGIPATLAALGLREDQVDWTAEQSLGAARLVKNNPRPLDLTAMRRIVRAAFDGDRSLVRDPA